MLFLINILSHLFSVDNFVGNIFLHILDIFRNKEQSNYVGVACKWHDKLRGDYVLWTRNYFRSYLSVHYYVVLKNYTVAAFWDYCRQNLLLVFYLLLRDIYSGKILLVWDIINCFYYTVLVVNHRVDVISECNCWVKIQLKKRACELAISSLVLCLKDYFVKWYSRFDFLIIIIWLERKVR